MNINNYQSLQGLSLSQIASEIIDQFNRILHDGIRHFLNNKQNEIKGKTDKFYQGWKVNEVFLNSLKNGI